MASQLRGNWQRDRVQIAGMVATAQLRRHNKRVIGNKNAKEYKSPAWWPQLRGNWQNGREHERDHERVQIAGMVMEAKLQPSHFYTTTAITSFTQPQQSHFSRLVSRQLN